MDQVAAELAEGETEALDVAARIARAAPLLRPALAEALSFWKPGRPPSTVLLGDLGNAFAAEFHKIAGPQRTEVARIVEDAAGSPSEPVRAAASTGFLEAAIHRGERDGTWADIAAVLLPRSRAFSDAYRNDRFFGMASPAEPEPMTPRP